MTSKWEPENRDLGALPKSENEAVAAARAQVGAHWKDLKWVAKRSPLTCGAKRDQKRPEWRRQGPSWS